MSGVAAILGRTYALQGSVVHGDKRGRELGYPTANIALPPLLKLPAHGIYAVRATVRGKTYDGAASLGVRPTIAAGERTSLEVHLFDFATDIYGARMDVAFVKKIRDEAKFDSLAELTEAMARDCVTAKTILARKP